jgi:hypothetical protein
MKIGSLVLKLAQMVSSVGLRRLLVLVSLAALAVLGSAAHRRHGFVAHEWGTFTSVQGADGVLLDWRPLENSRLPGFIYNWQKPGLGRISSSPAAYGKSSMVTLQRMETPVIYFYTQQKQRVDVSVQFPKGLITEWYPQASGIGPSTVPAPPWIAKLDQWSHKAGAKSTFSFAQWLGSQDIKDSRARWANVQLLPPEASSSLSSSLPTDRSGSHYFTARDTDAAYLRLNSLSSTNPAPEIEKFIFYRGVGSFPTPLSVTMNAEGKLKMANTGPEMIESLFVLQVENGAGWFVSIDRLAPANEREVQVGSTESLKPLGQLSEELGKRLADALVAAGLYRREATAMVATWKDSWFQEDGVRVLYLLPRPWTDRTLPLTMQPAPTELTRVMVGRTEVLTPLLLNSLQTALLKAKLGDAKAREQVIAGFRKLGRFSEPALRLIAQRTDPPTSQLAWTLWQSAASSNPARGVL